jgi:hypothetical protein
MMNEKKYWLCFASFFSIIDDEVVLLLHTLLVLDGLGDEQVAETLRAELVDLLTKVFDLTRDEHGLEARHGRYGLVDLVDVLLGQWLLATRASSRVLGLALLQVLLLQVVLLLQLLVVVEVLVGLGGELVCVLDQRAHNFLQHVAYFVVSINI